MTTVPVYIVEAFTVGNNQPYTGNPAAVCILHYDDDISDEAKQKIATTMNLSETAFVALDWTKNGPLETENKTKNYEADHTGTIKRTIRWFTPKDEVPLCGHATVATAKAVMSLLNDIKESAPKSKPKQNVKRIEFQSKFSGVLPAELTAATKFNTNEKGSDDFITLNFPVNLTTKIELEPNSKPDYWLIDFTRVVLGSSFPFEGNNLSAVVEDVQVELQHSFILFRLKNVKGQEPEETIKKVQPNFVQLMEPTGDEEVNIGVPHAIIVTIQGEGNDKPDFYSRFFAPFYGIDEDPVTGWAHTVLTPYWTKVFGFEKSKVFHARQSSARGGDLMCQLQGQSQGHGEGQCQGQDGKEEEENDRAFLSGRARIVVKGELHI